MILTFSAISRTQKVSSKDTVYYLTWGRYAYDILSRLRLADSAIVSTRTKCSIYFLDGRLLDDLTPIENLLVV